MSLIVNTETHYTLGLHVNDDVLLFRELIFLSDNADKLVIRVNRVNYCPVCYD